MFLSHKVKLWDSGVLKLMSLHRQIENICLANDLILKNTENNYANLVIKAL
jgi:hypothetical protein